MQTSPCECLHSWLPLRVLKDLPGMSWVVWTRDWNGVPRSQGWQCCDCWKMDTNKYKFLKCRCMTKFTFTLTATQGRRDVAQPKWGAHIPARQRHPLGRWSLSIWWERSTMSLGKLLFCHCHGVLLYPPESTPVLKTKNLPAHQGYKPQTLLLPARMGKPRSTSQESVSQQLWLRDAQVCPCNQ